MFRIFKNPVAYYILAVFFAWIVVFMLTAGLPDASYALSGGKATGENLQYIRHQLQLDQPIWNQFVNFWNRLLTGKLQSYYSAQPLHIVLITKLKQSCYLLIMAIAALIILSLVWILILSWRHTSHLAVSVLIGITSSIPLFISLPIMLFICGRLGISSLLAGGFCLAIYPSMLLATNLVDTDSRKRTPIPYLVLAHQCGLSGADWLAMKLRASYSAIQIILNSIAFFILVGIPVAEFMLGLPGAGRWMLESILRIDLPVVYLCVTLSTLLCAIIFYCSEIYTNWTGARQAS